ncbi:hypothetical protein XELAEV_18031784mg [Xenopus laevis]|nr:hypothetical protein XELAEV_18031784mg [Xenopus laevis]
METFVFEKYVRYTFTIYPVAIVAAVGVYTGSETSSELSTVNMINVVIIGVSSFACLLRIILLFTCHKLRPLFSEKTLNTFKEEIIGSGKKTLGIQGHINPITIEMAES